MPTVAMACEPMGCSGPGRLPPRRLGVLPHALLQEPDARPSIALALEQLQAVDMALDGTIAPGECEARCDRREVFAQALGKAGERFNPARGRLRDPGLEGLAPAFPHEGQKRLAQCIGRLFRAFGDAGFRATKGI
jgi:hypothetical protein